MPVFPFDDVVPGRTDDTENETNHAADHNLFGSKISILKDELVRVGAYVNAVDADHIVPSYAPVETFYTPPVGTPTGFGSLEFGVTPLTDPARGNSYDPDGLANSATNNGWFLAHQFFIHPTGAIPYAGGYIGIQTAAGGQVGTWRDTPCAIFAIFGGTGVVGGAGPYGGSPAGMWADIGSESGSFTATAIIKIDWPLMKDVRTKVEYISAGVFKGSISLDGGTNWYEIGTITGHGNGYPSGGTDTWQKLNDYMVTFLEGYSFPQGQHYPGELGHAAFKLHHFSAEGGTVFPISTTITNREQSQQYFINNDDDELPQMRSHAWFVGGGPTSGAVEAQIITEAGYGDAGGRLWNSGAQPAFRRMPAWERPTGTSARTTFVQSTVTVAELAKRVKALIEDLHEAGVIGPT